MRPSLGAIRERWRAEATDPVTRGWLIVTGASAARLLLGLIASTAIARSLGPSDFATYAVLGVVATIAGVVCDPGLTAGGVRRIASAALDSAAQIRIRTSAFVLLRAGFGLGAALIVIGLRQPITRLLPGEFAPTLIALVMLGVVASAVSGALSSVHQAARRFGRVALVLLTNTGLTAALALGLARTGRLDLSAAIAILGVGTTLASAVVAARLLPDDLRPRVVSLSALRGELDEELRFGAWVWLGDLIAIVAAQVDLLIVGRWLEPAVLGAYALALNLAGKADVANHSLYTVLQSTASALAGPNAARRYLQRSLARSGAIACLLLLLLPISGPIILNLYSPAYSEAIRPFQLLLGVALVDIFLTPVGLLAYHANRPRILPAADAARLAVFLAAAVVLVPSFGVTGAVLARLASRLAGATVVVVGLRGSLNRWSQARIADFSPE
jgi:O-antigen/teichoic acid export membrane protein